MENPSGEKSIIVLGAWLDTISGQYVRGWEQTLLDELTVDIFGFNAMQIGLPQINALQANRMPHKWVTDTVFPTQAQQDEAAPDRMRVVVVHDFTDLPFASQSLDLIVLPHVLEFSNEPHQILREVERVLIPEGQVIVCGFNMFSLWGARQLLGKLTDAPFLPEEGEFITLQRLKDWMKLLNMEVSQSHYGCYAPPCATEKWLNRFDFMEQAGNRWWPYFGAVYVLHAIKRIKGMRLIGPVWSKNSVPVPNAVTATNKSRRKKHG